MAYVFLFSAHTEPLNSKVAKKKPPDPAVSVKRSYAAMMMTVTCLRNRIEKHGKPGSGTSSSNRSPNYGDGKNMQALGGMKDNGKVREKTAEKGSQLIRGSKLGSKKAEG
ncbi:hypothetical protein QYF36_012870 [Acer negundo]|nr:hypothetical protein QYF36_012870 [Acer negundo]